MRGGKGKSGGRKHFWIRTVKYEPDRYKKVGFMSPQNLQKHKTVNVGELKDFVLKNLLEEENILKTNMVFVDLESLGFQKLLGNGKVDIPYKIRVAEYSDKAFEKIRAAGGEILEFE
jgi:large subunit ribosomal protein L15